MEPLAPRAEKSLGSLHARFTANMADDRPPERSGQPASGVWSRALVRPSLPGSGSTRTLTCPAPSSCPGEAEHHLRQGSLFLPLPRSWRGRVGEGGAARSTSPTVPGTRSSRAQSRDERNAAKNRSFLDCARNERFFAGIRSRWGSGAVIQKSRVRSPLAEDPSGSSGSPLRWRRTRPGRPDRLSAGGGPIRVVRIASPLAEDPFGSSGSPLRWRRTRPGRPDRLSAGGGPIRVVRIASPLAEERGTSTSAPPPLPTWCGRRRPRRFRL